jgi:predicted  nucleic acid-binding Zn-ribbon protein
MSLIGINSTGAPKASPTVPPGRQSLKDSYVIQIPYLTDKRRNELEILLSIFDQSNPADPEHHLLNIRENEFPEKYRPIIRKLQKAILDSDIKKKMELEDGIIDELEDLEREIEDLEQKLDTAEQVTDQVKQENDQIKQQNDQIKQENDQIKQEKEVLRIELENLRKELNNKD